MAVKARGKKPAAKAEAAEIATGEASTATAKLTLSIKRRLGDGSEVFIAPGIEMHCAADDLDATQEAITERVQSWVDVMLEAYPDPADQDFEDDEGEDEGEDEDEDEGEDEDEDEDEGGDDPTEEEILKMKKADLLQIIEDYELEVEAKGLKIADLRAAVIEELFEEDEGEDEDEDEGEDDEDEDEAYEEAELKGMKLEDLIEIADEWELEVSVKKSAKLPAKKAAYVAAILEAQEEE